MRITNVQKKQLSDILTKADLKISDFITSGSNDEFNIKYRYDFFSFSIKKIDDDVYQACICPVNNIKGYKFDTHWRDLRPHYEKWISNLSLELTTPTGWETFESFNYFNVNPDGFNAQFTVVEKASVVKGINLLKAHFQSLQVPKATLDGIDFKLSELALRLDELNKFDWTSLFIGTIVNLIMAFSIPPESAGFIWHFIKNTFTYMSIAS